MCGKNCKIVLDEFVCQYCNICNKNDHHEGDCPNFCMNWSEDCIHPKLGDLSYCIYCYALHRTIYCAGDGRACDIQFSEEYPHKSSSLKTIHGYEFTFRYCSTCTRNIFPWKIQYYMGKGQY